MLLVSDIHGAFDALARVARMGEPLLVLGDLLNFIDYRTNEGLLAEVAGTGFVARLVSLRAAGLRDEARAMWREFSAGREDEIKRKYEDLISASYRAAAEALRGCEGYVTYGNVDRPDLLEKSLPEGVRYVDAEVVEIEGCRVGFVGGGAYALGSPGEVTEEEMAGKLDRLGPVEILCTHVAPAVRPLSTDVIGGRSKESTAVLDYLLEHRPSRHYFGDIHQPQAVSWRVGDTLCRNAGYFRATGLPFGMFEVDLGILAAGYAHRRPSEAGRKRAGRAAAEARLSAGDLAIDVGGGRGRHAAVFAGTGAAAVVVDRSPAMASAARAAGVHAVVGDGGALPISSDAAALVHFHTSIHYGTPARWLREAARVVRPGGTVWVWNFDRDTVRDGFLAGWFPTIGEIDEVRFPATGHLVAVLEDAGLGSIGTAADVEMIERTAGDWIATVEAGFVSTLQLVDPVEIERGIARFRRRYPDPDEILRYGVAYRAVWGRRPQ